ncbi:hypothetical protein E2C01_040911 [Portunus trituberculatus]|uniref:Uncharacterized protein n=1 Tax=Portunus trituberculatus TaxID=210409 RepID=A0A5B7FS24_PORTR|nr:hypothetical protein [Portunus trituberculatus]
MSGELRPYTSISTSSDIFQTPRPPLLHTLQLSTCSRPVELRPVVHGQLSTASFPRPVVPSTWGGDHKCPEVGLLCGINA